MREESTWILSCSRLSYWKRLDRIIRALAVARQAGCDCQLVAAGDGPEKQRLEAIAAELGLQKEVIWLGPVPHEEIYRLMRLADLFIIANDVTNRCNPLFEAIRASLPVVSVRDPSTQDLLTDGDNACLGEPDDGEQLGECLTRACSDPELLQKMRRAQRSRDSLLSTWQERMDVEVSDLVALAGEPLPGQARKRSG